MIATSRQFRKLVRTQFPDLMWRSKYQSNSWTDKTSDPNIRRCAMRLKDMDESTALKFIEDLNFMMFVVGYENQVTLYNGSYLRFKAKIKE